MNAETLINFFAFQMFNLNDYLEKSIGEQVLQKA